jgi:hypothetical protein
LLPGGSSRQLGEVESGLRSRMMPKAGEFGGPKRPRCPEHRPETSDAEITTDTNRRGEPSSSTVVIEPIYAAQNVMTLNHALSRVVACVLPPPLPSEPRTEARYRFDQLLVSEQMGLFDD